MRIVGYEARPVDPRTTADQRQELCDVDGRSAQSIDGSAVRARYRWFGPVVPPPSWREWNATFDSIRAAASAVEPIQEYFDMTLWLRQRAMVFSISVLAAGCMLPPPAAHADLYYFTHTWDYVYGPDFDAMDVSYPPTPAGGTLDNTYLWVDPSGGEGVISTNGVDTIFIEWPQSTLAAGITLMYSFSSDSLILSNQGHLYNNGQLVGLIYVGLGIVFSPSGGEQIGEFQNTLELIPAPGALALLGLAGVLTCRRRTD